VLEGGVYLISVNINLANENTSNQWKRIIFEKLTVAQQVKNSPPSGELKG
jgi:hypothetical protein